MAMTDPIADLLTRIRNGIQEKHEKIVVPASRIKANFVRVLKDEGFIRNFRLLRDERNHPIIKVYLKYTPDGKSVIQGIKRVSSPGLRRYVGYRHIPRFVGGAGVTILTTPRGLMTGQRARNQKVGGEALCEVW